MIKKSFIALFLVSALGSCVYAPWQSWQPRQKINWDKYEYEEMDINKRIQKEKKKKKKGKSVIKKK